MTGTSNKTIVIDDDSSVQEVARAYLDDGYLVFVAGTAAQGLATAARVRPGLIVLDLMLPDRSGEDVCREVRERSDVPVLMLTAKAGEQVLDAYTAAGIVEALSTGQGRRHRWCSDIRRREDTQPVDNSFRCGPARPKPAASASQ
jgi:CheY-like chemotaxis protein